MGRERGGSQMIPDAGRLWGRLLRQQVVRKGRAGRASLPLSESCQGSRISLAL